VRAVYVSFEHSPDDDDEYESTLGCPVRVHAAWSGFVLSRETWALPMRRRDPVLLAVLERQADARMARLPPAEDLVAHVRRAVTTGLADGRASMTEIARQLAMAPRTLQRRLSDEATTFQRVVEEVRRDAAERHLGESALSIAEISFALGYSEPAAFHRAFRRWKRTTPQAYRATRRR
jgi:AraC-like DNA-binding protein